MKQMILVLAFVGLSSVLLAQETTKQKEIGLVFSNLDNFGLMYKSGTDQAMWRLRTTVLNGTFQTNKTGDLEDKSNDIGLSLAFGREKIKPLDQKFSFRYGADLGFSFSHSKNKGTDPVNQFNNLTVKQNTFSVGINLVLGVNYQLNEHFVAGAELLPYLGYNAFKRETTAFDNTVTENTFSGFRFNISNNTLMLNLVYRF